MKTVIELELFACFWWEKKIRREMIKAQNKAFEICDTILPTFLNL